MTEIVRPKYESSDGRCLISADEVQAAEYRYAWAGMMGLIRGMRDGLMRKAGYYTVDGKMVPPGEQCPWCSHSFPEKP